MVPVAVSHGGSATGSAVGIASDVAAGRRTAEQVITETLETIHLQNPQLNAFVEIRGDEAIAQARRIDAHLESGGSPGPLAGVPVAVKDSIWEKDHQATAGSRSLLGFHPEEDAVVVERLKAAGAIIVGRTNLPEFCYRGDCRNELYGPTWNPWDLSRTPGGSSGGSASAVAAGMVPVALGSDGGGSIRIPASFTGVIGLKPSFGLVPKTPGWPGWSDLNHLGPLTYSVEDAALVLSVIAGRHPGDPTTVTAPESWAPPPMEHPVDPSTLRIAYSEDLGYIPVDDEVRHAFRESIAVMQQQGLDLVEAHPDCANPLDIWNTLTFADNVASEGYLLSTGEVGADAAALIRQGEQVSGPDYARARNSRQEFAATWQQFMTDFDLILTPAMECVAFDGSRQKPEVIDGRSIAGHDDDWCHFCYPFNLTGQPALSIPLPRRSGDLPIGLQVVGNPHRDEQVLQFARWWEQQFRPQRPPSSAQRSREACSHG